MAVRVLGRVLLDPLAPNREVVVAVVVPLAGRQLGKQLGEVGEETAFVLVDHDRARCVRRVDEGHPVVDLRTPDRGAYVVGEVDQLRRLLGDQVVILEMMLHATRSLTAAGRVSVPRRHW